MIKCKNFFGTSGSNGSKSADVYFNEWIKAHQDIDILGQHRTICKRHFSEQQQP